MTGSNETPSFVAMNLPTGSATPPKTRIPIIPARNFPVGAISELGDDCPHAIPDTCIPINTIADNKNHRISFSLLG